MVRHATIVQPALKLPLNVEGGSSFREVIQQVGLRLEVIVLHEFNGFLVISNSSRYITCLEQENANVTERGRNICRVPNATLHLERLSLSGECVFDPALLVIKHRKIGH